MMKFEAGKKYYNNGLVYEITKRTAKMVTYKALQHAGRFNERVVKEGKTKIHEWPIGEVILIGRWTIEAESCID